MTAKDREIQRYFIGFDGAEIPHDRGNVVLYADHLRAVKLAQIEALENLPMNVLRNGDGSAVLYRTDIDFAIESKLAALRKELEV